MVGFHQCLAASCSRQAADRVAALRRAFDLAMEDKDLRAEAARSGLTIAVTSSFALTKLVDDLMAAPKKLVDKMQELMK